MAYYVAKAALVFKKGQNRQEYEKALPALRNFYGSIANMSTTSFDAKQVAQLELEWWIVHRQRDLHQPSDLGQVLAQAAAAIYQIPLNE
jgi:hypothetical protein